MWFVWITSYLFVLFFGLVAGPYVSFRLINRWVEQTEKPVDEPKVNIEERLDPYTSRRTAWLWN